MSEKELQNHGKDRESKSLNESKSNKFYGIPYPKIYLYEIRLSCPFCRKTGVKKIHKNLWRLRLHFSAFHNSGDEGVKSRNLINKLTTFIRTQQGLKERGVLRE